MKANMCKYGDIKYTKEDLERIIANKEQRLEDLKNCWSDFTKHMECGEIRELKQSCINDEIIIACLKFIIDNQLIDVRFGTFDGISMEDLNEEERNVINNICKRNRNKTNQENNNV